MNHSRKEEKLENESVQVVQRGCFDVEGRTQSRSSIAKWQSGAGHIPEVRFLGWTTSFSKPSYKTEIQEKEQ